MNAGTSPGRRAGWLLAAFLLGPGPLRAANPHALWQIVHGRCVPDQELHRDPAPCIVVDEPAGFAVLKDIVGPEQLLLIPTARIAGIEDPVLRRPDAPNYFAAAWAQRPRIEALLHRTLPRDDLSLAINSAYGRSQDQMHIHIDCIDPAVHDALGSGLAGIGPQWRDLPVMLSGHRYRAMRIVGAQLADVDPFRLLAASLPDPQRQMGRHTLVLVGAQLPEPGFVLLDGSLDLLRLDRASGEELQDHSCAILRTGSQRAGSQGAGGQGLSAAR